jgi:hypothetical protein
VPRCLAVAALLAGLLACDRSSSSDSGAPGENDGYTLDGGGSPGSPAECVLAGDCVLVASTCCECPSFAAPLGSDLADGCDAVECPGPDDCSPVTATCRAGQCELVCPRIVTELVCAGGFARDAAGCLVDMCAVPDADAETSACDADPDCVQVAADCCGCARGGEDTAVASEAAAAFASELGCTGAESCPGVDVCEPERTPRCIEGQCSLVGQDPGRGGGDVAFCGTPDHPSCEAGSVCVLNAEDVKDAAVLGVGVCQPV